MGNLAKYPRAPLRGTANHDSIAASVCENKFGFLGRINVTIRRHRNIYALLYGTNGVVFGCAVVEIAAGSAVYGERLYAALLGDARNTERVLVLPVPTSTYLQGDRHVDCVYDRFQNSRHQRFIFHQCGTGIDFANFLGGAAHVDVDDVRAFIDVVTRGVRHHCGCGPSDLHHDGVYLALVVTTTY